MKTSSPYSHWPLLTSPLKIQCGLLIPTVWHDNQTVMIIHQYLWSLDFFYLFITVIFRQWCSFSENSQHTCCRFYTDIHLFQSFVKNEIIYTQATKYSFYDHFTFCYETGLGTHTHVTSLLEPHYSGISLWGKMFEGMQFSQFDHRFARTEKDCIFKLFVFILIYFHGSTSCCYLSFIPYCICLLLRQILANKCFSKIIPADYVKAWVPFCVHVLQENCYYTSKHCY